MALRRLYIPERAWHGGVSVTQWHTRIPLYIRCCAAYGKGRWGAQRSFEAVKLRMQPRHGEAGSVSCLVLFYKYFVFVLSPLPTFPPIFHHIIHGYIPGCHRGDTAGIPRDLLLEGETGRRTPGAGAMTFLGSGHLSVVQRASLPGGAAKGKGFWWYGDGVCALHGDAVSGAVTALMPAVSFFRLFFFFFPSGTLLCSGLSCFSTSLLSLLVFSCFFPSHPAWPYVGGFGRM